MLGKTYKTALREKLTTYDRVIEPQPIAGRSRNTLSRIGRKAFHKRCRASRQPHLQWIVRPTPYRKGILLHGGPPSDFQFRLDEDHKNEGRIVRVKTKPRHATVRPPKCVIYMSRNPITYSIHRHRELFQKDEDA